MALRNICHLKNGNQATESKSFCEPYLNNLDFLKRKYSKLKIFLFFPVLLITVSLISNLKTFLKRKTFIQTLSSCTANQRIQLKVPVLKEVNKTHLSFPALFLLNRGFQPILYFSHDRAF